MAFPLNPSRIACQLLSKELYYPHGKSDSRVPWQERLGDWIQYALCLFFCTPRSLDKDQVSGGGRDYILYLQAYPHSNQQYSNTIKPRDNPLFPQAIFLTPQSMKHSYGWRFKNTEMCRRKPFQPPTQPPASSSSTFCRGNVPAKGISPCIN